MARYRVIEKSFIGQHIVEPGGEVDYAGEASDNMVLIPTDGAEGDDGKAE